MDTLLSTAIFIVLLTLASHRLTRLITRDKLALIKVPRDWFVSRWATFDKVPPDLAREMRNKSLSGKKTNIVMRSLAYLIECDWCMGFWVSGIMTYGSTYYMDYPWPWWVVSLAVASGVGLIAVREPQEPEEE